MESKPVSVQNAVDAILQSGMSLETLLQEIVAQTSDSAVESRGATQEKWSRASLEPSEEDLALLHSLPGLIGSTAILEPSQVTQDHIELLATEIVALRKLQDMIKGRLEGDHRTGGLRGYVFDILDSPDGGELISSTQSVRLVKSIRGNKPYVDIELLEQNVGEEQFNQLTNVQIVVRTLLDPDGEIIEESKETMRILNNDAVLRQIKSGSLGMDILERVVKTTPKVSAFNVHPVKDV